ncbi:helix-turn-helix domain-containing protein [Pseudenterobacter timonensis]|uniref:Helix-turn-helix domain-containing protein n=1 Tax=Pseudenterobacter timonensis TaxID=1755099 RepID=A0AAE4DPA9_9ENTR|nr:helix-turn-helix domain-containing protein [Pseudenterobacter timonensis]MDR9891418.1 helix-turn-helix domain-containing protein [Pseudenterobacter timonensis]
MFKSKIVTQIIDHIETNIDTPVKIEDIACYSGFSRRYVQIIFKERIGMPLGQYLRNKRIMRAATLLRLTNTPIIEIAYSLHFDSQQTFTREFKKLTKHTPLAYRKAKVWYLDIYKTPQLPFSLPPLKPSLCTLPGEAIAGYKIHYDEPIPCPRIMSEYRWDNIVRFKQRQQQDIWLLTEFCPSVRTQHAMSISTAIGILSEDDQATTEYEYPQGLYAVFSFSGTRDEYHRHIKNIYYSSLPYWGYNRRQGPDVECFYHIDSTNEGLICCDTFIPVVLNESTKYRLHSV